MTRGAFIMVTFLVIAAPAAAQTFEVSALLGYATPADIEQKTNNVEDLTITGSLTMAASGTYFLGERLGVEGWYSRQSTAVRLETADSSADLFDMTISSVLANVVYQLRPRSAALQPFVFGGAGVAVFTASDIEMESKFAWTAGGGVKWRLTPSFAARIGARYQGTRLNDSSAVVCDPFGFCQSSLPQAEVTGGIVVRF